jgi:hypothetical protein
MSFSVPDFRRRQTLALAVATIVGFASVQVRGQGERIHFSEPTGGVSASNINANLPSSSNPFAPPTAFKQMQDDLFRPLAESLHDSSSMDSVFPVPPPSQQSQAPLSRHAREMLDRRLNWAFSDFEELNGNSSSDNILGSIGLDGDDSSEPVSLVNQYFDNLGKKSDTRRNSAFGGESPDPNAALIRRYDPDSLTDVGEKNFIDKLFDAKLNQKKSSVGNFNSASGQQNGGMENPLVEERRLDNFRRYSLMDPTTPTPKREDSMSAVYFDQLGATYGGADAAPKPAVTDDPHHSVLYRAPQFADPTISALHSAVYDDPTAVALGLNNPPPPVVAPKPPVTAQSVQNLLNPFAAVVKKPNF